MRKPCNRPNCKLCGSGAKHPALIFTCRVDGKGKCFHIRSRHEALMRQAVENGRKLEALIARAGVDPGANVTGILPDVEIAVPFPCEFGFSCRDVLKCSNRSDA